MTDSPQHAEYSRRAKREGIFALRCFFIILFWIILSVAAVAATVAIGGIDPGGATYAAVFFALVVIAAVLLTRVYLSLEYDYIILSGIMTVSAIYGKRRRKVIIELDLRKITYLAPFTEENKSRIERAATAGTYYALSDKKSKEAFCALFSDEKGRPCSLIFDADKKFQVCVRFYNPSAFTGIKT